MGNIIQQSILEEDTGRSLTHPTLITKLCRGVVIVEDKEECPSVVLISFPR